MEQGEVPKPSRSATEPKLRSTTAAGEKLLNYVQAVAQHPDFAREIPRFFSRVGSGYTEEIQPPVARIERKCRGEFIVAYAPANDLDGSPFATVPCLPSMFGTGRVPWVKIPCQPN